VGLANHNVSISDSYASVEVNGNDNVGGLVGLANHNVSISDSYASVEVNGNDNVGGLVGYAYNTGTSTNISGSYAAGEVNGNGNAGGLVGCAAGSGSASVSDSYALVAGVTGNSNVGRVIGSSSNITLSNNYAWKGMAVMSGGMAEYRTSTDGNANAALDGTDGADIRTGTAIKTNGRGYPTFDFDGVWTFGYKYGSGGYNVTELTNLPILKAFNNTDFPDAVQSPYLPGEEIPPYEIWNWADLAYINVIINEGRLDDYSVFRLMQNIGVTEGVDAGNGNGPDGVYGGSNAADDCPYTQPERRLGSYGYESGDTGLLVGVAGAPLTVSAWDGGGWIPLGDGNGNVFSDVFEGRGYEISGLWIDRVNSDYQGLFGSIKNGTDIKDVGVNTAGAGVKGKQRVGGLAGNADGGVSISGSRVSGKISGDTSVGGLVGNGNGVSISNSYVSGEISGTQMVGGLVGTVNGAGGISVSNSYVSGEISGVSDVGGLLGLVFLSRANISGSYASGEVSGTGNFVGGLAGWIYGDAGSSVSNSYALVASVTGKADVGRVAGSVSNVALSNNYAWEEMVVTVNGTAVNRASGSPNAAHNKIDGADISGIDAVNANRSGYSAFDFNSVWTFDYEYGTGDYNVTELTNLPILKVFNNAYFPNAVQPPYLPKMSEAEILTPSGDGYEDFSGFRILRGQWYNESASKVTYLVRVNEKSDPDYIKTVIGNFAITGASSNGFENTINETTNLYTLFMEVDGLDLTTANVGDEVDIGGTNYCEISFNITNTLKSGIADFTLSYTENSKVLATGVQTALIPGDVDKEAKVGSSDHTLIYNYMKSIFQSPRLLADGEYVFELADINKDGKISTSDHTLVYNMYRNNIPTN
jgi:hypothetical protein